MGKCFSLIGSVLILGIVENLRDKSWQKDLLTKMKVAKHLSSYHKDKKDVVRVLGLYQVFLREVIFVSANAKKVNFRGVLKKKSH